MGERMVGREMVTSTFPGRAGIPLLGWMAGLGPAISFKEILAGPISSSWTPALPAAFPLFWQKGAGACCIFLAASQQGLLGTGRPD